jgi:hypothetical protein
MRHQRLIRIEAAVLDRLRTVRRPGGSYSDVILRIAGREGADSVADRYNEGRR